MNSHDVLRTAVKIGGLVLLIYSAIQATSYFPLFLDQAGNTGLGISVVSILSIMLVPIIFGLLLWLFPASIANTIIKKDLAVKSQDKFLVGIEKIAIRILGFYLLYHGITDLVSQYVSYHQAAEMFGKNTNFSGKERFTTGFIVIGVKIVLSLLLILGATGITKILQKVRNVS
jgi:hypothetical protein